MRRALGSAIALVILGPILGGCEGSSELDLELTVDGTPPPPALIEGAPGDGLPLPAVRTVTPATTPRVLGLLGGAVVVGASTGLLRGAFDAPNTLSPVAVQAEPGEPASTGEVRFLSRRGSAGLLALAAAGIFHDRFGALLFSPMSQSLAPLTLLSVDAYGAGADEEVWLRAADGAYVVAEGQLWRLSIARRPGVPDAVVGAGPARAVVTLNGTAYLVDRRLLTAAPIALDLGAVHAWARAADGAIYLATQAGLVRRAADGRVTRWTFAPPAEAAAEVLGVAAGYGKVAAVLAQGVVRVDAAPAQVLPLTGPEVAHPLALDALGDLWAKRGTSTVRVLTGHPTSFAGEVLPFLQAHCHACHLTGEAGAPIIDMTDYTVVKSYAALIVRRLEADGLSPMPPPNVETLTADEFGPMLRWAATGMAP